MKHNESNEALLTGLPQPCGTSRDVSVTSPSCLIGQVGHLIPADDTTTKMLLLRTPCLAETYLFPLIATLTWLRQALFFLHYSS